MELPARPRYGRLIRVAFILALGIGWLAILPQPAAAQGGAAQSIARTVPERGVVPKKEASFSADRFVRSFRSNREEVRTRALDDVEAQHLQNPDLPAALWKAIENDLRTKRTGEALFRAIRLHGRLDAPQVVEQQIELLKAADPRVVVLAADNLAARRPAAALKPLLRLTERPEYAASFGFRRAVVAAVGQIEDRESIDFLVSTLAKTDGQLKYETSRQLARLTGQDFGGKAEAWRAWWKENRDTFRFGVVPPPEQVAGSKLAAGPKPAASPQAIPWDDPLPTFFGTPVYAKRVVFVIDRSKSMLSSVDGVTRLEEAQREFEGAVRKLSDDTWFEVLAYETFVTPWQGQLVQATPQMKSDAIRFSTSLTPINKTASYDALVKAIERDQAIEAVLFLSDGEPTAGAIIDKGVILHEITRMNRFLRASINTIGIDARGVTEDFLRQLAEANFGEYHSIR